MTILSMLEQLLGIISMFPPEGIINEDVRIKKYVFYRLNKALRRGSLSISSSEMDAQPLQRLISGDTGITLYVFFLATLTDSFFTTVRLLKYLKKPRQARMGLPWPNGLIKMTNRFDLNRGTCQPS